MISTINISNNINCLGYSTTKKEKFRLDKNINENKENNKIEENKGYFTPQQLFEMEKAKERRMNNIKTYYNENHNNYDIDNKDYKYSIYASKDIILGAHYGFGEFLDIKEVEKIMPLGEFEKLVTEYINIFNQEDWFKGSYTNEFIVSMSEHYALAEISGKAFRTDKGAFLYDEEHGWEYCEGDRVVFHISDVAPNLQDILTNIAKYINENYVKNLTFDYWDKFLDDIDKMPDDSELKKSFAEFNKVFKD
ncbi:hypothetical protein [[Clostridium] colinum]|uniref:hypothetical protein n=1 Tax=[Clostridium] colinum TaxID=36835 RepID=UPI00202470AB|nr:hypothetical protein [[Clostridium] colinum]